MRSYFFKTTILIFFSIPIITTANDSYFRTIAGNVFPAERADSIQLIKERVYVHLSEPKSHVHCKFWICNYGESKNIVAGFPEINYKGWPNWTYPITNFTCAINGQKITKINIVKEKEYSAVNDKHAIAGRQWYKWEMSIGKNDTVLIENEYDGDWGQYVCRKTCFYTIGTGSTWDGPIVDGRITFDHSDLFSTNVIIRKKVTGGRVQPTYYDDSIVYSFSNYTPDSNEDVGFWMFQITWPTFDDSKYNQCPYQGVETVETARKLKNELYALHGYPFKDTTLLHYYSARKWYKKDQKYDSTKFSDADIGFLKNLDGIEKILNSKQ